MQDVLISVLNELYIMGSGLNFSVMDGGTIEKRVLVDNNIVPRILNP